MEIKGGIIVSCRLQGDYFHTKAVQKVVEFFAPCDGVLTRCRIGDGEVFQAGSVLGYIEGAGIGDSNFLKNIT